MILTMRWMKSEEVSAGLHAHGVTSNEKSLLFTACKS